MFLKASLAPIRLGWLATLDAQSASATIPIPVRIQARRPLFVAGSPAFGTEQGAIGARNLLDSVTTAVFSPLNRRLL
jgi:hypothetical protein